MTDTELKRLAAEYGETRQRALSEFWDFRARPFFHCDTNINLDKV